MPGSSITVVELEALWPAHLALVVMLRTVQLNMAIKGMTDSAMPPAGEPKRPCPHTTHTFSQHASSPVERSYTKASSSILENTHPLQSRTPFVPSAAFHPSPSGSRHAPLINDTSWSQALVLLHAFHGTEQGLLHARTGRLNLRMLTWKISQKICITT